MDDRSDGADRAQRLFLAQHQVNCSNPFLTDSERAQWCDAYGLTGPTTPRRLLIGRRNVEGGGRQDDIGHESIRAVVGVRGDINDAGHTTSPASTARRHSHSTYLNDFSAVRTEKALHAVVDASGQPVCLVNADFDGDGLPDDPSSADPQCVPWNIFPLDANGNSLVTPQQVAYLATPGVIRGPGPERVLDANVTGDFSDTVKLPSADRPASR